MTKESEREGQKEGGPEGKAERDELHPAILFQAGGAGHHHFQSCSLTAVLSILKVRFH